MLQPLLALRQCHCSLFAYINRLRTPPVARLLDVMRHGDCSVALPNSVLASYAKLPFWSAPLSATGL